MFSNGTKLSKIQTELKIICHVNKNKSTFFSVQRLISIYISSSNIYFSHFHKILLNIILTKTGCFEKFKGRKNGNYNIQQNLSAQQIHYNSLSKLTIKV